MEQYLLYIIIALIILTAILNFVFRQRARNGNLRQNLLDIQKNLDRFEQGIKNDFRISGVRLICKKRSTYISSRYRWGTLKWLPAEPSGRAYI